MVLGLDVAAAAAADFGNQERWKNLVGVVANTAQDAAQVAFKAANIVPTDSGSPHSSINKNKASTASSKPFDEKKSDLDCRNDTTSSTSSTPTTPTRTPGQRRRRDADSSSDSTTDVVEGIARNGVALVTPSPPKKSAVLPPIVVMPTDHLAASSDGEQAAEVRLATVKSVTAAAKAADSISSSSPEHKLTLKLLRGVDFPTIDEIPQIYSTRLLIQLSVLRRSTTTNEGSTDDDDEDIIETIEITDRSQQIWGGPVFTFDLECNDEDEIMLSLIKHDRDTGVSRMIGRTSRQVAFLLNHLRPRLNPNRWVELSSTDTSIMKSIESLGKIQARLSIKTTAVLHEQENCKTISAGPALAANHPTNLMTTYNIRKHALWCTTPVMLNVYDVSLDPRIENLNGYMKAVGSGGIFHAAIEIYGREWSFGGTRNKRSCVTGVFSSVPKQCPMHHYRETIYLGDCHLTHREVAGIVSDLRPEWIANSYNLFRKNCCFFSRELAVQLGVGDIPEWVYSLATSAEFIEPYLQKLNTYLTDRARAAKNDKIKKGTKTNIATKDAVPPKGATTAKVETRETVVIDAEADVEEIEVEAGEEIKAEADVEETEVKSEEETEVGYDDEEKQQREEEKEEKSQPPAHVEFMMDHAMAAKIQRSFRRSQKVAGNHRGGEHVC